MNWNPPRFDRHQFQKRSRAIYARYTPEGWETSGISFADLRASMHVGGRMKQHERRLGTPSWAVNNEELREVLLKFCERRLLIIFGRGRKKHDVTGLTQEQRVERIRQKELQSAKDWEQVLVGLRERCKTEPEETKHGLETQIQNADTQIVMCRRGILAIGAAIVYFYFRLGFDSVAVAKELGIKPPHVRQIIARLHLAATGTVYRSPNPKWQRIREFQSELCRIKKLWSVVKRATDECNHKQERQELRRQRQKERELKCQQQTELAAIAKQYQGERKNRKWTRDRVLFIHFHLLSGAVSRETIAKKVGIKRADSMMQGYRYFLTNPQKLRS